MAKYFGTDGIRGLANQSPMSPEFVLKLGQSIGTYFKKRYPHPKILIGKDTRRSGYMLEQALGAGICSVGVDVFQLGPLPTPGIAYLTRGLRACAGIVISASHNPYHDNGIKIFNYDGYKLPDEVEGELENMLEAPSIELPTGMSIGKAKRIEDAIGQYAVFLKEQFPKQLTLEGLRIVIDCAHGAAYRVAPKVFSELGAEIFTLGDEPNGRNINDGCGALHPNDLKESVRLYKADLGIALDGDADRLILVDKRGEIVDGDEILAVCAEHMIHEGNLAQNTVVATIMSNMGLDIFLKSRGAQLIRTKVGDRYVVEKMRSDKLNLGGEQSGHLVFRDSSTTGDGILAALHILKIMTLTSKPLHELKSVMQKLPQRLKNIKVKKKIPLEQLSKTQTLIAKIEKDFAGKGRVIVRYSGTEDLVRVMLEGEKEKQVHDYCDDIADSIVTEISQIA
jgi:phosphoglucosamine mutase